MTQQTTPETITSQAVTYRAKGGYDVIEVVQRDVRAPGEGEVRIEVAAAAVNPTDLLMRDPGLGDPTFPAVPGMDAAGVVEAVGPGVSRLRRGDRVMAAVLPRRPEGGAQARHIVVPAASVVAAPEAASLPQASTLPMNGLTALLALELSGLQAGQWLAVTGGAGHLARLAIAVARRQGIKVVADAKSTEMALVRDYGATTVVERSESFSAAVRRAVPAGVDALLDAAVLGEEAFAALRDGGVYLPVRGWGDQPAPRGILVRPVLVYQVLDRTDWLEHLRDMATQGEIGLQVAGEFAPEDAADAQRLLAAGGLRGRAVIVFAEERASN